MSKDDNEIIKLSCSKCDGSVSGTYKELFGDLPSLMGLPKLVCKCGGDIILDLTGKYKQGPPLQMKPLIEQLKDDAK